MKKALVVLVVLACVGAMAFADGTPKWSISNLYGFGVYMPSSGNVIVPFDYAKEGGDRTRLGFTYTAADGNAGFNSRLQMVDPINGLPLFNQLNGWGKLFGGMLTVRAGILDDYTIAGTGDWLCLGNTDGSLGIFFDVTPMTGLDIGFFQQIPAIGSSPANLNGDIVGARYAVPNLVTVAGGVMLASQTAITGNTVYVGADVKAVQNLVLDVEAGFVLADGDTGIKAVEHVVYTMGALSFGGYAGQFNDKGGLDWGIEPVVNYKVDSNLTVGVDVNIYNYGNTTWVNPATKGVLNLSFVTPLDGGPFGALAGDAAKINFGGGAHLMYAADGFTLTVGDYYAAGTNLGNMVYVNADLSL